MSCSDLQTVVKHRVLISTQLLAILRPEAHGMGQQKDDVNLSMNDVPPLPNQGILPTNWDVSCFQPPWPMKGGLDIDLSSASVPHEPSWTGWEGIAAIAKDLPANCLVATASYEFMYACMYVYV